MRNLGALSAPERKIIECFAEKLVPQGGSFSLGAKDVRISEFVEDYLSNLPLSLIWSVRGLFLLFNFAVYPLANKVRPFTGLKDAQQIAYIESWEKSPVYFKRAGLKLLSTLVMMGVYHDARVAQAISYRPKSTVAE
ncbi:MAG: hypothetical protein HYR55_07710 [Acidobacteria bacterium]|nr:hypothetical protein [Acidobacteriota bacterium]MBI3656596.1 hypothetical protein [Acidobacteriota bacterium]